MTRAACLTLLSLLAACIPAEGPMMAPFQDCLGCHGGGGDANTWTVAGTWFKGSAVTVVDSAGKSVTMHGNLAGNFYTAEGLQFPITIAVDGVTMVASTAPTVPLRSSYGGCNACHYAWQVTTGANMAPGTNCLTSTCHGPGGAGQEFVAAGTFPGGGTVTIQGGTGNCSAQTNSVGNFFIYKAACTATFPRDVSVQNKGTMRPAPRGGCNGGGCHDRNGNAED